MSPFLPPSNRPRVCTSQIVLVEIMGRNFLICKTSVIFLCTRLSYFFFHPKLPMMSELIRIGKTPEQFDRVVTWNDPVLFFSTQLYRK